MSASYEEIVLGESLLRHPPGARHEMICGRLHARIAASLANVAVARLLPARTLIELAPGTLVRPDLTLVTSATGKPWLIAEIVDTPDHHTDTVTKKTMYEELRLPRLWMVDPRYDNVEVYHSSPYGLTLKHILAQRDFLTEALLPELRLAIPELFGP
jgi:Uma2 family endonuclease